MREAIIVCLTRMVRIPDLDLEMFKGDEERMPEEKARGSEDLEMMRRLNAVSVRYEKICNTLRPAVPQAPPLRRGSERSGGLRLVRPPPMGESAPQRPSPSPQRQIPPPQVDLEVLADALARRLGGELDRVIEAVRENRPVLVQGVRQPGSEVLAGTVDEEMPMFLPQNIVDHEAKADIQAIESTGEAAGIDDAAAALKKARKKKPKEK